MLPNLADHTGASFTVHLEYRSPHRSLSSANLHPSPPFNHMNHSSVNQFLRKKTPIFKTEHHETSFPPTRMSKGQTLLSPLADLRSPMGVSTYDLGLPPARPALRPPLRPPLPSPCPLTRDSPLPPPFHPPSVSRPAPVLSPRPTTSRPPKTAPPPPSPPASRPPGRAALRRGRCPQLVPLLPLYPPIPSSPCVSRPPTPSVLSPAPAGAPRGPSPSPCPLRFCAPLPSHWTDPAEQTGRKPTLLSR